MKIFTAQMRLGFIFFSVAIKAAIISPVPALHVFNQQSSLTVNPPCKKFQSFDNAIGISKEFINCLTSPANIITKDSMKALINDLNGVNMVTDKILKTSEKLYKQIDEFQYKLLFDKSLIKGTYYFTKMVTWAQKQYNPILYADFEFDEFYLRNPDQELNQQAFFDNYILHAAARMNTFYSEALGTDLLINNPVFKTAFSQIATLNKLRNIMISNDKKISFEKNLEFVNKNLKTSSIVFRNFIIYLRDNANNRKTDDEDIDRFHNFYSYVMDFYYKRLDEEYKALA